MFNSSDDVAILMDVKTAASHGLNSSKGKLQLSFKRRGLQTVPEKLFQSGCLRARLLTAEPKHATEFIIVNTAGGLTGGDRLAIDVLWGSGTEATLTGQASEKIYRALLDVARIDTKLTLESGAVGEWLPQETILFNQSALRRSTKVHVASDASFLGLESIILGRTAMKEAVTNGYLRDSWRIWRDGKMIYADAIEMKGLIAEKLRHGAVTRGATAFASLILVAPDCEAKLPRVRAILADAGGLAAASTWNGLLAIRFIADTGAALRRDIISAVRFLRPERTLPRVWQC